MVLVNVDFKSNLFNPAGVTDYQTVSIRNYFKIPTTPEEVAGCTSQ